MNLIVCSNRRVATPQDTWPHAIDTAGYSRHRRRQPRSNTNLPNKLRTKHLSRLVSGYSVTTVGFETHWNSNWKLCNAQYDDIYVEINKSSTVTLRTLNTLHIASVSITNGKTVRVLYHSKFYSTSVNQLQRITKNDNWITKMAFDYWSSTNWKRQH